MSNKDEKISITEAYRLNKRALGIWWRQSPGILLSLMACSIATAIIPLVEIYLSARIINELAGERDTQVLIKLVIAVLVIVSVLNLFKGCFDRWKNSKHACIHYIQMKVYSDKLLSMDFCSTQDPETGELLSQIQQNDRWSGWGLRRFIEDAEKLIKAFIQICGSIALTVTLFSLPIPEGAGAIVVLNRPVFSVIIVLIMLAVTIISPALSNKANGYWVKCAEDAKAGNRAFSFYGFMGYDRERALDIRMNRQEILCGKYQRESASAFSPKSKIADYAKGPMGALSAASAAVSYVFTAIVYIFVCLKAWGGAFGVGSVTQYVNAITSLSKGVVEFLSTLGYMRYNASFLRKSFEFLGIPNVMYKGSLTVEKRSDRKYEIEFRDVSFKYPGSDAWALRHVSMRFRIGERLAVVGQNGSGKTTFIKLLCRLYDPTEGEILLNGIDIRKYDYKEYISIFSIVFQDFKLFAFQLGQNVASGINPQKEKVEECLREAGFLERYEKLPEGIDTFLYKDFEDKGVEVSGGEAQKIAIARALYKDAPFIILDEPTAALDPVAEMEIYSKFNEIVGDKTAVFISHRLSSCRFCDEIAVFHEGQVVQQGRHEALVEDALGKYHELWNAQAQYYTVA